MRVMKCTEIIDVYKRQIWKYMGDKKRMGDTGDKVILYAAQADAVLKAIERDGRCFSREEYVLSLIHI